MVRVYLQKENEEEERKEEDKEEEEERKKFLFLTILFWNIRQLVTRMIFEDSL